MNGPAPRFVICPTRRDQIKQGDGAVELMLTLLDTVLLMPLASVTVSVMLKLEPEVLWPVHVAGSPSVQPVSWVQLDEFDHE
jgi:hypothetical protein